MSAAITVAPPHQYILGLRVDASDYSAATKTMVRWAQNGESRYVCVANVHMVMEAYDDPAFREIVNRADFVTSDGMPLVWALRMMGATAATRVYGPDLTPWLCAQAARQGIAVGFFGGTGTVLDLLTSKLQKRFPAMRIAYRHSPPFRSLSADEDAEIVAAINASGARILFVGLGCPKQERWMADHKDKIQVVMVGVGAAFDFLAGNKRQAPRVVQNLGMEWFFRLLSEPRRLWRRYLYHNPRFLRLLASQLLGEWQRSASARGNREQAGRRVQLGVTRVYTAEGILRTEKEKP